MDTKLLIDAIVHQTTVLIAQLSTAAGIRAPLARVADQVFLELSREIEAQGISRKVAADMFGLAIRSYQKKVQRLTESVTTPDQTLWQAVLGYLAEAESKTRRELLEHFGRDEPIVVGSVLNDLVSSGLVFRTGNGDSAIFRIVPERDLGRGIRERKVESLAPVLWLVIYRSGGTTLARLREQFQVDEDVLAAALALLEDDGRLQRSGDGEGTAYQASTFLVPVGAESGWEAAVFDHFQTVVTAIASKVRKGQPRSAAENVVGGATLTFDLGPAHPRRDEVLGLLRNVRTSVNELWTRVQEHNERHPIPDEERTEVSFYFGQCVKGPDDE
jgi:hypothetical protein